MQLLNICFNPAEAEEGFKRKDNKPMNSFHNSFNPAEAEEGFKRQKMDL